MHPTETFNPKLAVKTSPEFIELKYDLEQTLNRTYQDLKGFIKAIVKSFKKGSVVVVYDLIFDSKQSGSTTAVKSSVETTTKASIADGTLGVYNVNPDSFVVIDVVSLKSTAKEESKSLAMWAIVLIVSSCVLLVLVILLALQWVRPFPFAS